MKKILFSVAMAFVLVSCSHDEVIEINRDGDEIQFNVVSDAATRAADVYCNNNMPERFRVWAFTNQSGVTDGAPYIVGDHIERQGEKAPYTWKNIDGTRYWPKEGNLYFLAEVNAGDYFLDGGAIPCYFNDYEVPTEVANQKDLMYAFTNCSKGTVNLNFRHALSQIVFRAQNKNDNLHVVIEGVTICNLAGKGSLMLGSYRTDGNINDHKGNGTLADRNGWKVSKDIDAKILAGGNTDYSVTFNPVAVPGDGEVYPLTSENDTDKEFSSNAMLLLPQTTTAWEPKTDNAEPGAETQTGTYFLVNCKIYNVTYPDKGYQPGYEADLLLHEGPAAIPVAFDWKEGKKYTYTFVFGDGNGGYIPVPPGPDPEPVLTPITFNVTVDDFVAVENKDYEYDMTTKN